MRRGRDKSHLELSRYGVTGIHEYRNIVLTEEVMLKPMTEFSQESDSERHGSRGVDGVRKKVYNRQNVIIGIRVSQSDYNELVLYCFYISIQCLQL